jgi:tetratricopeptide (TPR) repeat protein
VRCFQIERTTMDEELAKKAEILKNLASAEAYGGDYSAALKHGQEALKLYEKLGDLPNLVLVHIMLARIFGEGPLVLQDQAKSLEHVEAARPLAEPGPDTPEKAFFYTAIAHQYLHTDEPATSVTWARKAEDLAGRLGTFVGTPLGSALARMGELDKGMECQEKDWEFYVQAGNPLGIELCGHQTILTRALARNIPLALKWEKIIGPEVARISRASANAVNRSLVLTHTLSGEVSKAMETYQIAQSFDINAAATCWLEDSASLGFLYLRAGDWDRARQVLEEALSMHNDAHNTVAVKAFYFVLGSLSLEEGDFPKAEELLLKSVEICRKGGNVLFELWVLPVLAELYLKMGQPDKAREYVDRGFELMKPGQNWYGLPAPVYLAKGTLATARRDWDTATDSFDKAIEINRQYQLPWDEARTLYERGLIYLTRGGQGDRDKAHKDLDEALAVFQKVGARKDVEKVLRKKEMLKA